MHKIFIVEDEEIIAKNIQKHLERGCNLKYK